MSSQDPFEIVAAANPVPALVERLPGDDEMLARILAMPPAAAPKRRPRKRIIWIGAGVAVASVGLAAYAFLREESPKNPISLTCYLTPQRQPSKQVVVGMSPDPIAVCGELWTNGTIASLREAPELTACVLDTGVVAVLPGNKGVCAKIGLANWVGELTDEETNLIAFQEAFSAQFGERCVAEDDAMPLVRSLMVQFGYSDWTVVERGGYSTTRQCTAAGINVEEKLVVVASRRGTTDT